MQTETAWAKTTFTLDEMIALDAIIGKHAPRLTKSVTEARERLAASAARAGVSVAEAKTMLAKAKTITVAPPAAKKKAAAKKTAAPKKAASKKAPPAPPKAATAEAKTGTGDKLDKIEKALRKPAGATLEALSALTGWKPHSVRARIAEGLKRDRGLTVTSERGDKGSVYRIVTEG